MVLLLGCVALSFLSGNPALAADRPLVAMLCPSMQEDHPFWGPFLDALESAADSLEMDLRIHRFEGSRFELPESAIRAIYSGEKPDYLLFPYFIETGHEVLELAEQTGVTSYIVNADIPSAEKRLLGAPGKDYSKWFGGMVPDDYMAGLLLGRELIRAAQEQGHVGPDGKVHVIAVSGGRDTLVARKRNMGLLEAIRESQAVLDRLVHCYWDERTAHEKVRLLFEQGADARVIWAASDRMALAAHKAVQECGLEADTLVGGIDWSGPGLKAVAEGKLAASVGGHVLEGAWGLVRLYDHWHGHPRALPEFSFSRMWTVRDSRAVFVMEFMRKRFWRSCDFKRFTLTHSKRDFYSFLLEEVACACGNRSVGKSLPGSECLLVQREN